jgi:hypothetical protein
VGDNASGMPVTVWLFSVILVKWLASFAVQQLLHDKIQAIKHVANTSTSEMHESCQAAAPVPAVYSVHWTVVQSAAGPQTTSCLPPMPLTAPVALSAGCWPGSKAGPAAAAPQMPRCLVLTVARAVGLGCLLRCW